MTSSNLKLLLLLMNITIGTADIDLHLRTIVNELNYEFKIELNILVNLNNTRELGNYQSILRTSGKPLIVYNEEREKVTPIYKQQSKNILTIVWLHDLGNFDDNIEFLDRILWKLHFSDILFIVEQLEEQELLYVFQQCWLKGLTNVLVLLENNTLYTYHPYPNVYVVKLDHVKEYFDKQHLLDFQGYKMQVPFRERAPRCFKYTNRLGQVIRAGYWYKLIELFITHYNGTIETFDVSVEDTKQQKYIIELAATNNFSFVPTSMHFSDYFSNSDVFYLSKVLIICSMPQEIDKSLYITTSFEMYVWLLCIITLIMFGLIMSLIHKFVKNVWCLNVAFLDALTTMLNINSVYLRKRSTLVYILHLMPLLSGFLLSNFYICNLSSMSTTKVFEAPIRTLLDILKTDQLILESANDVNLVLSLDSIPLAIKDRVTSNNTVDSNKELRTTLNVSAYFFTGPDDLTHFYLFQQKYLKRPFATFIPQPLYYWPFFIAVPHRSPVLQHFNRYLKYAQENGLYQKYQHDAQWDGVMGGELIFFGSLNSNEALNLNYFLYAFVLLAVGLLCSIIAFIVEICNGKRNKK